MIATSGPRLTAGALLSCIAFAGVAVAAPARQQESRLIVATSVAPLANIARNVVGDRAEVVQLIPDGTDSHTYEPSPRNAKDLERADVVFLNGLHLEQPTLKLAQANAQKGTQIILMGEKTITPGQYLFDFSFPKSGGDPNPHLWMNPTYARRYSEIVSTTMAARDPKNASRYRANQRAFAARIGTLDRAIATSVKTIPSANRKLVTYHDSFAYFAPRYGFKVIGAIQPADFSEPTPKEVQAIIEQVKRLKVPAIFGSEVFPSSVLAAVAKESGAKYIDKLRDDDLPGALDAPQHSYIGMLVEDVRTMTTALGGNPRALNAVPVANVSSAR